LHGFTITKQASTIFAGSPAYYIQANNVGDNTAVIEEAVLLTNHVPSNSDNFYDIVHAVNGTSTDLSSLESGWQWND
jgi:hypothetical protein